ncbi:MAG: hypothetical protein ACP5G0_02200 [Desulfomonilia bacterium]
MKQGILIIFILGIIVLPQGSQAEDSLWPLVTVTALGASVGMLAGATALVFSNDPGEHGDWVAYGGGIGAACGFAIALTTVIPTITLNETPEGRTNRTYGLVVRLPLR